MIRTGGRHKLTYRALPSSTDGSNYLSLDKQCSSLYRAHISRKPHCHGQCLTLLHHADFHEGEAIVDMPMEDEASTNVLLQHAGNSDLNIAKDNVREMSFERAVVQDSDQPSGT